MPFDSSGTFTRARGRDTWKGDAAALVKIRADLHDDNDNDVADGLTQCLTKTGVSLPTTDINWGNQRIVGLADPRPTFPQDAATKNYVDNLTGWPTSKAITGTDANGKLTFSGASGVNGVCWNPGINMSIVSKPAVAGKSPDALAINSNGSGTGVNVAFFDKAGRLNLSSGQLCYNLVYDGANWHTPTAGIGAQYAHGGTAFTINANNTATGDADDNATLTPQCGFNWGSGNASMTLYKDASGKGTYIQSFTGTTAPKSRWVMYLGDQAAEGTGATYTGSNFNLYGYDNNGANPRLCMDINRNTRAVNFYGDTILNSANLTLTGSTTARAYKVAATNGFICRFGMNQGDTANVFNIAWTASLAYLYIDATQMGAFAYQSDYRIKKDIQPLGSMWETVKRLSPIRYSHKAHGPIEADDIERWGFVAHELQEKLIASAATGKKDEENVIQSPNPWTLIAALTKALQEAMERIEALELHISEGL
jgi:endosialidase-like protein